MQNNKQAREKMGRLSLQMHGILDKAKGAGRGLNSDERERYHRMTEEFSSLEMQVLGEHSDGVMARMDAPGNGRGRRPEPSMLGGDLPSARQFEEIQDTYRLSRHDQRHRTPHDKAFSNYLRNNLDGLDGDDRELVLNGDGRGRGFGGGVRNVASTTTGSQGGYLIPQGFSDQLESAMKWLGGIDGVVGEFRTETGNPLPWPTNDDTANEGRIIGQNVQMVETDLTFGQVVFNAYIFSSDITLIPKALLQDSYFDLDALLAQKLGERIGRKLNNVCTLGSGTNQPNGIVTAAVAAGNVHQFATGNTTAVPYSEIVNVEHTVDPAYRYNKSTRFMFNDAVLKSLKLLVDGNSRPLWQPGLTASFQEGAAVDLLNSRPTILSHPYIINQDMATPSANAYTWLFGDMSKYKLRKVGGIEVLRLTERWADYLQVGFLAFLRADGQLVDAALTNGLSPIAVGQQSAN
jgi:HK97 family phage major capsid protein